MLCPFLTLVTEQPPKFLIIMSSVLLTGTDGTFSTPLSQANANNPNWGEEWEEQSGAGCFPP